MNFLIGDYLKKSYRFGGSQIDYYSVSEGAVASLQNLSFLETYSGPTSFDHAVIDYGDFFKSNLMQTTETSVVEKYIHDNPWFNLVGDRKKVAIIIAKIKDIANQNLADVKNSGLDSVYREQLALLSAQLGSFVDGKSDTDEMIIVPLRGGLLVASLLPQFDIRKVIPIDCKRIPLKDSVGHFAFGMSFRYFSHSTREMLLDKYASARRGSIQILEVAVGSGITTIGIMLDLYSRGILPHTIRLISPVVTFPGISLIKKIADQLSVDLELYTSACFPALGDFYHDRNDSVVDENGKYVVGNASNILEAFLHLDDLDSLFSSTHTL